MDFLHQYQCPNFIVEEVLQETKDLKFTKNAFNLIGDKEYYNFNMFRFIESCLSDIKNRYFSDDMNFYITYCWVNKTLKGQKHHKHSHINSVLSGIFYLTTNDSGNTVFLRPNPWLELERKQIFKLSKNSDLLDYAYEVRPERGKLIIFPSQIQHFVKENNKEEDRCTIAFNTFLSGVLGNNPSTFLKLNSKVKYL